MSSKLSFTKDEVYSRRPYIIKTMKRITDNFYNCFRVVSAKELNDNLYNALEEENKTHPGLLYTQKRLNPVELEIVIGGATDPDIFVEKIKKYLGIENDPDPATPNDLVEEIC